LETASCSFCGFSVRVAAPRGAIKNIERDIYTSSREVSLISGQYFSRVERWMDGYIYRVGNNGVGAFYLGILNPDPGARGRLMPINLHVLYYLLGGQVEYMDISSRAVLPSHITCAPDRRSHTQALIHQ